MTYTHFVLFQHGISPLYYLLLRAHGQAKIISRYWIYFVTITTSKNLISKESAVFFLLLACCIPKRFGLNNVLGV
jgi:hypothetical protein